MNWGQLWDNTNFFQVPNQKIIREIKKPNVTKAQTGFRLPSWKTTDPLPDVKDVAIVKVPKGKTLTKKCLPFEEGSYSGAFFMP